MTIKVHSGNVVMYITVNTRKETGLLPITICKWWNVDFQGLNLNNVCIKGMFTRIYNVNWTIYRMRVRTFFSNEISFELRLKCWPIQIYSLGNNFLRRKWSSRNWVFSVLHNNTKFRDSSLVHGLCELLWFQNPETKQQKRWNKGRMKWNFCWLLPKSIYEKYRNAYMTI